jgi:hypothetical protein
MIVERYIDDLVAAGKLRRDLLNDIAYIELAQ